ncbi:MAG: hypothetical protein J0L66_08640 [Cytophagales bacterium]|nr:hypothetical protein [Cytophagales bacterium]
MDAFTLRIPEENSLTDDELFRICAVNEELRIEREKWTANDCSLAWLIDPQEKKAYIYKPNTQATEVGFDTKLAGENILPGFAGFKKTWNKDFKLIRGRRGIPPFFIPPDYMHKKYILEFRLD